MSILLANYNILNLKFIQLELTQTILVQKTVYLEIKVHTNQDKFTDTLIKTAFFSLLSFDRFDMCACCF